jgi:hypothetical protein
MKTKILCRKDEKSLTVNNLLQFLTSAVKKYPHIMNMPISYPSDIECNGVQGLYGIEIADDEVTLLPDDNYKYRI